MQYRVHIKRFGNGFWSFHTPRFAYPQLPERSIFDNALVAGIDDMLLEYEKKYGKFDVIFSDTKIDCENIDFMKLTWVRGDRYDSQKGGNWYANSENKIGWLCPVLFDYFNPCPENIFIFLVKYQQTKDSRLTIKQLFEELKTKLLKNSVGFLESVEE